MRPTIFLSSFCISPQAKTGRKMERKVEKALSPTTSDGDKILCQIVREIDGKTKKQLKGFARAPNDTVEPLLSCIVDPDRPFRTRRWAAVLLLTVTRTWEETSFRVQDHSVHLRRLGKLIIDGPDELGFLSAAIVSSITQTKQEAARVWPPSSFPDLVTSEFPLDEKVTSRLEWLEKFETFVKSAREQAGSEERTPTAFQARAVEFDGRAMAPPDRTMYCFVSKCLTIAVMPPSAKACFFLDIPFSEIASEATYEEPLRDSQGVSQINVWIVDIELRPKEQNVLINGSDEHTKRIKVMFEGGEEPKALGQAIERNMLPRTSMGVPIDVSEKGDPYSQPLEQSPEIHEEDIEEDRRSTVLSEIPGTVLIPNSTEQAGQPLDIREPAEDIFGEILRRIPGENQDETPTVVHETIDAVEDADGGSQEQPTTIKAAVIIGKKAHPVPATVSGTAIVEREAVEPAEPAKAEDLIRGATTRKPSTLSRTTSMKAGGLASLTNALSPEPVEAPQPKRKCGSSANNTEEAFNGQVASTQKSQSKAPGEKQAAKEAVAKKATKPPASKGSKKIGTKSKPKPQSVETKHISDEDLDIFDVPGTDSEFEPSRKRPKAGAKGKAAVKKTVTRKAKTQKAPPKRERKVADDSEADEALDNAGDIAAPEENKQPIAKRTRGRPKKAPAEKPSPGTIPSAPIEIPSDASSSDEESVPQDDKPSMPPEATSRRAHQDRLDPGSRRVPRVVSLVDEQSAKKPNVVSFSKDGPKNQGRRLRLRPSSPEVPSDRPHTAQSSSVRSGKQRSVAAEAQTQPTLKLPGYQEASDPRSARSHKRQTAPEEATRSSKRVKMSPPLMYQDDGFVPIDVLESQIQEEKSVRKASQRSMTVNDDGSPIPDYHAFEMAPPDDIEPVVDTVPPQVDKQSPKRSVWAGLSDTLIGDEVDLDDILPQGGKARAAAIAEIDSRFKLTRPMPPKRKPYEQSLSNIQIKNRVLVDSTSSNPGVEVSALPSKTTVKKAQDPFTDKSDEVEQPKSNFLRDVERALKRPAKAKPAGRVTIRRAPSPVAPVAKMVVDDLSDSSTDVDMQEEPSSLDLADAEREWEAALAPRHRSILDLLRRISHRLVNHIVDSETAVTNIIDDFVKDSQFVLDDMDKEHIQQLSTMMNGGRHYGTGAAGQVEVLRAENVRLKKAYHEELAIWSQVKDAAEKQLHSLEAMIAQEVRLGGSS